MDLVVSRGRSGGRVSRGGVRLVRRGRRLRGRWRTVWLRGIAVGDKSGRDGLQNVEAGGQESDLRRMGGSLGLERFGVRGLEANDTGCIT